MNQQNKTPSSQQVDALIVGAGFAGLYMLHLLRDKLGLKVATIESASGVGGTWYWNNYPGARCDIASHHYSFSFSKELQQEWVWSEKYAAQDEILRYLEYVAKRFDLSKDIQFNCRVKSAAFDESSDRWLVTTDRGERYSAKYFIPAVGTLSSANIPVFKDQESFQGDTYFTGNWPNEGVDFKGKRVAIIGTGATAIQVIPEVAKQAAHLTVFQRTPNYAAPLQNEVLTEAEDQQLKANYDQLREASWNSFAGVPFPKLKGSALDDTQEQRLAHYEELWQDGGFSLWIGSYQDILYDKAANETLADFIRTKIRQRVHDPKIAEMLCPPKGQTYGTKRQPCETGYFETYNRDNVTLVDIKRSAIKEFTSTGLRTSDQHYEFDSLIYATGYDAFTGSLFKMDIKGRGGLSLQDHWAKGARTYLGLAASGFPNMFTITGPQSPSVLFNMPLAIEMHCEWIADCIAYINGRGLATIEAQATSEDDWLAETKKIADATLLPEASSWYMGANIPGKPRVFLVYLGGGQQYKEIIEKVAADDYSGFRLS